MSVKDPKWAKAVESALGGMLSCFLVHSQRDFRLLKDRYGGSFNGIIQPFATHIYQADLPESGYVTILSQIDTPYPCVSLLLCMN